MFNNISLAIAIFLGAVISSMIIGNSMLEIKSLNRFIAVKGLSEKTVKADKAVWSININAVGNNLVDLQNSIDKDINKTKEFLTKYKISDNEISKGNFKVTDKFAQSYTQEKTDTTSRYTVQMSLIVTTDKVEDIFVASQNIGQLLSSGVTLATQDYGYNGPRFLYTKISEIKPQMLEESTQNARLAAEEFAKNSNSKVGKIRTANQGVFSILPPAGGVNADESEFVDKIVRVVSSVDYYIKD